MEKSTNKKFRLYKGFKMVGIYDTIFDAKKNAPRADGVYNLKGKNYKDSWQIINGVLYGN